VPCHAFGFSTDVLGKLWVELFVLIFIERGLAKWNAELLFRPLYRRFDREVVQPKSLIWSTIFMSLP